MKAKLIAAHFFQGSVFVMAGFIMILAPIGIMLGEMQGALQAIGISLLMYFAAAAHRHLILKEQTQ